MVGQYGISAGTKLRTGICGAGSRFSRTLRRGTGIRFGRLRFGIVRLDVKGGVRIGGTKLSDIKLDSKHGNGYDPAGISNAGSAA